MVSETNIVSNDVQEKRILERHKDETFDCAQYSSITRSNCEQITLIWLDNQLEQTSQFANDIHLTEEMLRELNDYVQLFSSESNCLDYMESIKTETILLVVAGSSASSNLLEKTHRMRHVDSIFIFCQRTTSYEPLLRNKDYQKLAGVFNEREALASSISGSIEFVDKRSAIFALYNVEKQKSARNLNRESGSFIFLQLVKQVLQKMSSNNEAAQASKTEMLEQCRLYYRGNKKALDDIDRFEREYTSDQAIQWYTANSFLYRLVNKALRTEDIDALYTYRFFIVDLCKCLAEESELLHRFTSKINLYRGVKLPRTDRQRFCESIGHLISVNGYFSTSRNLNVSEVFADTGPNNTSNDLDSVVFDIEVDLEKYPELILADITHLSKYRDEEEVLFDVGTVFKIQSVEYNEQKQHWYFQMIATNEGQSIAKDYVDLKQVELNESNDIESTFGNLLFEMGDWLKSRMYFRNLDKRRPDDPYILFGIGRSYYNFDYPEQALQYFKTAYDLCVKGDNERLTLGAKICCHISNVYIDCSNYGDALCSANKALELYQSVGEETNRLGIAQALIRVGLVYYHQGKDVKSLDHFQRAYSIVKNIYPFDHPERSICLNFLAFAYYHIGDYSRSLRCLLKCSTAGGLLLPSDHPTALAIKNNIGKQCYKQGKYEEALERLIESGVTHADISKYGSRNRAMTYNNIGKTYYRLNNLNQADIYYEKAFQLIKNSFSSAFDQNDLAYTLKNMGEVQLARGNVANALELFQQAHDMYERIFARDGDHRDIAKCKYLLALAHVKNANDEEASRMFDKALQMWTNVLVKDHPDIALCHRSIAEYYAKITSLQDKAIMHFQMALCIYEKRLPNNHQDVVDIKDELHKLQRQ